MRDVGELKNLSVVVSDTTYEKFLRIQKREGFKNQSDTLEFLIEQAAKEMKQ